MDSLINEKKAAGILGCSTATLQQWRHYGKPPNYVKVGRLVRYREKDLQQFVESQVREGCL